MHGPAGLLPTRRRPPLRRPGYALALLGASLVACGGGATDAFEPADGGGLAADAASDPGTDAGPSADAPAVDAAVVDAAPAADASGPDADARRADAGPGVDAGLADGALTPTGDAGPPDAQPGGDLDAGLDADAGHDRPEGSLTWRIDWVWGDAEPVDGGGWSVVNELGHRFEIKQGFLVDYQASLQACPAPPDAGMGAWLLDLVGIGIAHAGHSVNPDIPTAWPDTFIEPIHEPTTREVATLRPPPGEYCSVHYLVARADFDTREIERYDGDVLPDMLGKSVYLSGRWWPAGEVEPRPFFFDTRFANGALQDVEIVLGDAPVEITITRDLGGILRDADPDAMSDRELEQAVLRNLLNDTRFTIDLLDD